MNAYEYLVICTPKKTAEVPEPSAFLVFETVQIVLAKDVETARMMVARVIPAHHVIAECQILIRPFSKG